MNGEEGRDEDGAIAFTVMRIAFWKVGATGIPKFFGQQWLKGVAWGLVAGCIAAVLKWGYLFAVFRLHLFDNVLETTRDLIFENENWFILLVLIAAPIFEEFIFRGLIFRGLHRSWKLLSAILASSAIFAIVHPPFAVVPVFMLAASAAFAYERTAILLAPMIAHAIYNASVVWLDKLIVSYF